MACNGQPFRKYIYLGCMNMVKTLGHGSAFGLSDAAVGDLQYSFWFVVKYVCFVIEYPVFEVQGCHPKPVASLILL